MAAETESEYSERIASRMMLDILGMFGGKNTATVSVALFSVLALTMYRMGKELDQIVTGAEKAEQDMQAGEANGAGKQSASI